MRNEKEIIFYIFKEMKNVCRPTADQNVNIKSLQSNRKKPIDCRFQLLIWSSRMGQDFDYDKRMQRRQIKIICKEQNKEGFVQWINIEFKRAKCIEMCNRIVLHLWNCWIFFFFICLYFQRIILESRFLKKNQNIFNVCSDKKWIKIIIFKSHAKEKHVGSCRPTNSSPNECVNINEWNERSKRDFWIAFYLKYGTEYCFDYILILCAPAQFDK